MSGLSNKELTQKQVGSCVADKQICGPMFMRRLKKGFIPSVISEVTLERDVGDIREQCSQWRTMPVRFRKSLPCSGIGIEVSK